MTDADMEWDGRVADTNTYSGSDVVAPEINLPTCDQLIWADDRFEPSPNGYYRWIDE